MWCELGGAMCCGNIPLSLCLSFPDPARGYIKTFQYTLRLLTAGTQAGSKTEKQRDRQVDVQSW